MDHQYGGVGLNPKSTKAFHWGNGYHQFEHALVGYLYAQQMAKQSAKLYYARPAESKMPLNPYYFNADIKALSSQSDGVTTATFTNIRP